MFQKPDQPNMYRFNPYEQEGIIPKYLYSWNRAIGFP